MRRIGSMTMIGATLAVAMLAGLTPVPSAGAGAPVPMSQDCRSVRGVPGADVFLLIGQSNMSGYGRGYDPTLDGVQTSRIAQWSRAGTAVPAAETLQHADWSAGLTRVGMGTSFARAYLSTLPDQRTVLLVPAAYGGTGLQDGRGPWTPGASLFEDAVARLTAALAAAPGNCVGGILWHQGESDIGNANYSANLDAMVTALRARVPRAATAPFVLGHFVPEYVATHDTPEVRAIEAIIGDTPNRLANTAVVSTTGLAANVGDSIHFDAAAQRQLGVRYFEALGLAADTSRPRTPKNPAANVAPNGDVSFTWTASTDDVGIASYAVFRNGVVVQRVTAPSNALTGLAPGTHHLQVQAFDTGGNRSSKTAPVAVVVTVGDVAPPTAPTGLTASAQPDGSITASWTASKDNVGVAAYAVFRNGVELRQVPSLSTNLAGLGRGSHYLQVQAIDAAGNRGRKTAPVLVTI